MRQKAGIILGSGLTKFTEELNSQELIYEDKSSFHKFKIFSGKINESEVVLFSGRRHYYEGYPSGKILENVRIAKEMGVNRLILTNAAGGLNKNLRVSDIMLITSHYNFITSGIPSKSCSLYQSDEIYKIRSIAASEKINLKCGSYCCTYGPMYESKSEIRFLSKFGIDAVGMSTIPEMLYANKIGIKTLAFSCITNILSENCHDVTDHSEVIQAGLRSYPDFSRLLKKIISESF